MPGGSRLWGSTRLRIARAWSERRGVSSSALRQPSPSVTTAAALVRPALGADARSSAPAAKPLTGASIACWRVGRLYQCNRCKKQTSPTAGTIFHATKLPLTLWFAAGSHLVVTAKIRHRPSVELGRRKLGVKQLDGLGRDRTRSCAVMAQAVEGLDTELTAAEFDRWTTPYLRRHDQVRSGGEAECQRQLGRVQDRALRGRCRLLAPVPLRETPDPQARNAGAGQGLRSKRRRSRVGAKHWLAQRRGGCDGRTGLLERTRRNASSLQTTHARSATGNGPTGVTRMAFSSNG